MVYITIQFKSNMVMHKLHLALSVRNLEKSIIEYNQRLGCRPIALKKGRYALWRTDILNLSITQSFDDAGNLRHLGFEDPDVLKIFSEKDIDGFEWEYFSAEQQRQEILKYYPDIHYPEISISK